MGRPRKDRDAISKAILKDIETGMLVTNACKAHGITRETLNQWARQDVALSDAYARAREMQAHALAEEVLSIADGEETTSEGEQRRRVRVDARKWYTSKIAPKLYGDKMQIEAQGDHTLTVNVVYSGE